MYVKINGNNNSDKNIFLNFLPEGYRYYYNKNYNNILVYIC